jgi:hypothetical protein
MKWGELILLWLAGLWAFWVMAVMEKPLVYYSTSPLGNTFKLPAVDVILPIWIIFGLVWITLYRRRT